MAEAIVADAIVKLLEYLGRSVVKEIAPYLGGRNKLKELEHTMRMIQARLLDAERLRESEDGAVVKLWLKRLKHVLYQLEDLFEEFAVAYKENEQMPRGKLTKSLSICFSRSIPFKMNKKVAQEAKAIMKDLKAITSDMLSLNLKVQPIEFEEQCVANLSYRRQTHSFVMEGDVIGREDDKRALIKMILNSDDAVGGSLSVVPIVGIGGLGKTTLAQLVFNDENVEKHFEVKGWTCISGISDLEKVVGKVLKAITEEDCHQFSLQQLQSRLRKAVSGKKYLLVLDDVWDEDREKWLRLRCLLCDGKQGSKIIVTSRSRVVAQNMGTVEPYELKGLSEDESWKLFRNLAVKVGREERNQNLMSIGREIVKKCANVPLAIRTIAGLLYSKDTETEWESIKDMELCMIEQNEADIMSTLKLSYNHLPPQLKQCFAYCSLFPKGCELRKQDLVYLWMAQGFIRSSNGSQSPEDVGHGYFMELLRRCFFQDDGRDDDGEIISCKMHDLMHDLAQHAAGGDCLLVDGHELKPHIDENTWHASFMVDSWAFQAPSLLFSAKQMRSLLLLSDTMLKNEIFLSLKCLRALDLTGVDTDNLPSSIGKLKHLRYLRLGISNRVCVPKWVTTMQNLQTLYLPYGEDHELPRDFHKLINLRHLHTRGSLIDLPPKFGQLTSLRILDVFIVGQCNGLDALASLNHLSGKLEIRFGKLGREAISEATAANLKSKKLTSLVLVLVSTLQSSYENGLYDTVLECLQLPLSLRSLQVIDWNVLRFPRWGKGELPNLVFAKIVGCYKCQHLPALSQLPYLRFLHLEQLEALKHIEISADVNITGTSSSTAVYFPSLERLLLKNLYNLESWQRVDGDYISQYFPRLSQVTIAGCPKLISMPHMPNLESLEAKVTHGKLLKHVLCGEESPTTLRQLKIQSACELDSLLINLPLLESLEIMCCDQLRTLMAESPNSLRKLCIFRCERLRDISGALKHLPVLEELEIRHCEELDFRDVMDDCDVTSAWQGLKGLRSLKLVNISKMEALPRGLGCLTALQELEIEDCPLLERRCQQPDGEDWPLIQHIPHLQLWF